MEFKSGKRVSQAICDYGPWSACWLYWLMPENPVMTCSIPIGCPLTPSANQFSILPGEKGCFVAYPTGDRPLKP